MTQPQNQLADFCQWWPEGQRRPCYAPAGLVLVRPSGQTVGFSCAAHAPAWAGRIHGKYRVLEWGEWETPAEATAGTSWVGSVGLAHY